MTETLVEMLQRGESAARGYNDYNRYAPRPGGTGHFRGADSEIDFAQMTVGEIRRNQGLPWDHPDKLHAVGRYQIIGTTLQESIERLRLDPGERFTPELQDRILVDYLLKQKPGRADIREYITGQEGATLRDAQVAMANEWASVAHPDTGGSVYPGNHASITPAQSAAALEGARDAYRAALQAGQTPDAAWRAASGLGQTPGRMQTTSVPEGSELRYGNVDPRVGELQRMLNQTRPADRQILVDNDFRGQTRDALIEFQRSAGLTPSGVATLETLDSLRSKAVSPSAVPLTATPAREGATSQGPRSFEEVMRLMLPPQAGTTPHMTSDFGPRTLNGRPDHHGGVDFNYRGGQTGINLQNPVVRAPVSGTVEIIANSQYNTVGIRDADGNLHQILHLSSRTVQNGQRIEAGDAIGTMGGQGPRGPTQYDRHVHYQMRGPNGSVLDPEAFWNNRTRDRSEGATPRREESSMVAPGQRQVGAMSDGVLKSGDRGDEVRAYLTKLDQLGYKGPRGESLLANRPEIFGPAAKYATEQFQQAHGLKVDGKAGADTLPALDNALKRPLLSESLHPANTYFRTVAEQIEKIRPGTDIRVAMNVAKEGIQEGFRDPQIGFDQTRGLFAIGPKPAAGVVPGMQTRVEAAVPGESPQAMSDRAATDFKALTQESTRMVVPPQVIDPTLLEQPKVKQPVMG